MLKVRPVQAGLTFSAIESQHLRSLNELITFKIDGLLSRDVRQSQFSNGVDTSTTATPA